MVEVVSDGTRQAYRDAVKRIEQLEKLNATLAAEIDRMCPVVEVAIGTATDIRRIYGEQRWADKLQKAVATYEASGEGADGRK